MDIVFQVISGVLVGSVGCIAILMVVLPIYAAMGIFVNRPNGLERSGFHLFTKIVPGQVKIIDREGKLVRMIMDAGGKKFARAGDNKNLAAYWEIVDLKPGDKSENPTDDVWLPIRWWARIVYDLTGAVFIGIYPFARIREYSLEKTTIRRNESGHAVEGQSASNLVLEVKADLSDHLRIREFQFPMRISGADTADKISLDIIGVAEMEVVNPYKASYGTDRWDNKVINLVTDTIVQTTKGMSLDQALTAVAPEDVKRIQDAVRAIENDTEVCGINITGFRILEINPILTDDGKKSIQAEALAIQQAKATRIDGNARADALKAINAANEVGGQHAVESMRAEALVRAAEAAGKGGGSVILMPGGSKGSDVDPTQVAILAEMRRINQNLLKGKK